MNNCKVLFIPKSSSFLMIGNCLCSYLLLNKTQLLRLFHKYTFILWLIVLMLIRKKLLKEQLSALCNIWERKLIQSFILFHWIPNPQLPVWTILLITGIKAVESTAETECMATFQLLGYIILKCFLVSCNYCELHNFVFLPFVKGIAVEDAFRSIKFSVSIYCTGSAF